LDHDNIYDIITNEKLNIDNDTKIKIYLCNESRVIYTKINNMQITIDDYKNNEIFDIIIISTELNIKCINKIALQEF
jgi:membrane glycosyltransferase